MASKIVNREYSKDFIYLKNLKVWKNDENMKYQLCMKFSFFADFFYNDIFITTKSKNYTFILGYTAVIIFIFDSCDDFLNILILNISKKEKKCISFIIYFNII